MLILLGLLLEIHFNIFNILAFLPFLFKVSNHGRSTTVVVKPLFPIVANERVAPPPIEFGAFEKESTAIVNYNSLFGYF